MNLELKFTKTETALIDLFIAFTKEIFTKKPLDDTTIWTSPSFFPKATNGTRGHIGVTIWITNKGHYIINKIITIFKENISVYIQRDSLEKIILNYFMDNLFNENLFSGDSVLFSERKNLFESQIYKNPRMFGALLYKELSNTILANINEFLFCYPVSRIKSRSFSIDDEGIEFITSGDITLLDRYQRFPHLKFLNFTNGAMFSDKPHLYSKNTIDGWIVCKIVGEELSSPAIAKISIKMFFGILFSILSVDDISCSYRSIADSESGIFQFTKKASKFMDIGNILHPVLGEIYISDDNIVSLKQVYSKLKNLDSKQVKRFELATNYIINSFFLDDVDKYINLFIALDALWGIEGKSRKSIVSGIASVIGDNPLNVNKANSLYDLRCEIIHGSCLLLDNWKDIDKFINKYQNEPLRELQNIIFNAIKNVVL